jgi:hypothetical protein
VCVVYVVREFVCVWLYSIIIGLTKSKLNSSINTCMQEFVL